MAQSDIPRIDADVLQFMVDHRTPWLTDVFYAITTVGNTVAVTAVTLVLSLLLFRFGRKPDALFTVLTVFTSWLLMNALKYTFGRERPPMPQRLIDISSHSFPSGHAMLSATLASVVIVLAWGRDYPRKPAVFALVVLASFLIGLSRIYLGAHWLTDVVAGWVFGALWAVAAAQFLRRVTARRLD